MSSVEALRATSLSAFESLLATEQSLLDAIPSALYVCAADGSIVRFNAAAVALWGRTPKPGDTDERFCGSHLFYHLDGGRLPHTGTPMAVALATGEAQNDREVVIERPDGSRITALVNIEPLKSAAGHVQGAINCLQDISARKGVEDSLRDSEHHFRQILNALPAAVYTTDAEGRLTFYNDEAVRLAGREPKIGEDKWCVSWRLFRTDGVPLPLDECPMAQAIKERRPIRGDQVIAERPDGGKVPFMVHPTPIFDRSGTMTGAINILVDVSERERIEAKLSASDARYRGIFDGANIALWDQDFSALVDYLERLRAQGVSDPRAYFTSHPEEVANAIALVKVLNVNDFSVELFEAGDKASLLGQLGATFLPQTQPSFIDEIVALWEGRRRFEGECVVRTLKGRLLTVMVAIAWGGRHAERSLVSILDISKLKASERSLASRMEEQAALYELTARLHRANSLAEVHEAALDAILRALRCERASILLFDEASVMRFVAWRGLSDRYRRAVDGHSPWTPDAKDPRPICVEDAETSDLSPGLKDILKAEGIRALSFIPLVANDRLVGKFMTYYAEPHVFSSGETELALAAARQLAFGIEHERSEAALRGNEERLRLATQAGKVGIWEWDIGADRVTWSDSLYPMHGIEKERSVTDFAAYRALIHPEDRPRVVQAIERSLSGSAPYELEFRVLKPDGQISWVFANAMVVRDGDGQPTRMLGASLDITERKRNEAQRDLLVAELSHRVKNTLATVVSIARQSFSRGRSVEDARDSFDGRIRALARTHSHLAEGNWLGVSFEAMLQDEFEPYRRDDGGNIHVSGPRVMLDAKRAVSLGMAFHELTTNAAKYGALSKKSGKVEVAWQITPDNRLQVKWAESRGPSVSGPQSSGFGRLLLERALASDLRGKVQLDFEPTGLRCEMDFPLNETTDAIA